MKLLSSSTVHSCHAGGDGGGGGCKGGGTDGGGGGAAGGGPLKQGQRRWRPVCCICVIAWQFEEPVP